MSKVIDRQVAREQYVDSVLKYTKLFCSKHDFDEAEALGNWVGSDIGGIVDLGDRFVSFDDMRTDIDDCLEAGTWEDWYDYTLRLHSISTDIPVPNLRSWGKGCPRKSEEDIQALEELHKRVEDAKVALEDAIKNDGY